MNSNNYLQFDLVDVNEVKLSLGIVSVSVNEEPYVLVYD